jgi:predicted nucleic acid-binding protein
MTVLLDNTVLSNFSAIRQPNLVRAAFAEAVATTFHALREMETGVALGKIPACDWAWLGIVELTAVEGERFRDLTVHLGQGEASCLAVAIHRGYRLASDDKDARQWARRLAIPLTGTIGILAASVERRKLSLEDGNHLLQELIVAGYRSPMTTLDELLS